jgi:hypothetical protein
VLSDPTRSSLGATTPRSGGSKQEPVHSRSVPQARLMQLRCCKYAMVQRCARLETCASRFWQVFRLRPSQLAATFTRTHPMPCMQVAHVTRRSPSIRWVVASGGFWPAAAAVLTVEAAAAGHMEEAVTTAAVAETAAAAAVAAVTVVAAAVAVAVDDAYNFVVTSTMNRAIVINAGRYLLGWAHFQCPILENCDLRLGTNTRESWVSHELTTSATCTIRIVPEVCLSYNPVSCSTKET